MLKMPLLTFLWNGFCIGYLERYSDVVCQKLAFNVSQTHSLASCFNYRFSLTFVLSLLENSFLKIAGKNSERFNDLLKRCSFRLGNLAASDPTWLRVFHSISFTDSRKYH